MSLGDRTRNGGSPAAPERRPEASLRPSLIDLVEARFDRLSSAPAEKTLIICAAPRTGSSELCRFLIAAGIGVPAEYFSPLYAQPLAKRGGLPGDPLGEAGMDGYVDMLRRRLAVNNLFAVKLQYRRFRQHLRNRHGLALFERAVVVHLYRPDIAAQLASYQAARESGIWGPNSRITSRTPPQESGCFERILSEITTLVSEDAGFRELFALLGLRPLFLTMDELFAAPRIAVDRIAQAVGAEVDHAGLERAIAVSAPYAHPGARLPRNVDLADSLKAHAFGLS